MPAWHQAEAVGDESRALGEKDGQGFRLHFPVTHPFFFFFFVFLGLHPLHMEVPRLRVQSEL